MKVCNAAVTNTYVANIAFVIDPNPIALLPATAVRIYHGMDLLKDIPVGSSIKIDLTKSGITIPCMKVSWILGHKSFHLNYKVLKCSNTILIST